VQAVIPPEIAASSFMAMRAELAASADEGDSGQICCSRELEPMAECAKAPRQFAVGRVPASVSASDEHST